MAEERLRQLLEAVGDTDRILIVPHTDPDPDAIGSALALIHLLRERLGIEGEIAYRGIIGRAENKALVRYLGNPLRRLRRLDLRQPVPIALVDTQPGAGNNPLSPEAAVAVVIDHHPWSEATGGAAYADVRSDVGATSTILTEYLQAAGIETTQPLATALFYGIKADTMGLSRGARPADVMAYSYLQSQLDVEALAEIENAQVPPEYFMGFAAALRRARVYKGVVISYMGLMGYPDLAAEMADLLLRLRGTRWVICMGVYGDDFVLAVRTRSRRGDAGRLIRQIVGDRGTAGGHGMMAGADIPLDGEDPRAMARRMRRRARRYLRVDAKASGRRLI